MDFVAVHRGDGAGGCALGRDVDKAVTQPFSVCRIAGDRSSQHHPKGVEGFGQFIAKANGLEQLLCHTMDWLLRQIGYSNVAVYLAADDGDDVA